jgi:hypothetical protein
MFRRTWKPVALELDVAAASRMQGEHGRHTRQYPHTYATRAQVSTAAFEEMEPRSLFYRAATELAGLALRGESGLSLTEAIAVLLQTWNKDYYRFHRFDSQHFSDLEHSVDGHRRSGGATTSTA